MSRIRIGGVMRCCLVTLEEHEQAADYKPPEEGEKLKCKWCSEGLVFREGAWEWDRE